MASQNLFFQERFADLPSELPDLWARVFELLKLHGIPKLSRAYTNTHFYRVLPLESGGYIITKEGIANLASVKRLELFVRYLETGELEEGYGRFGSLRDPRIVDKSVEVVEHPIEVKRVKAE